MKANVGGFDKWIRIVAGLALIAWALTEWAGLGMDRGGAVGHRVVQFLPVVPADWLQ
jgi:hypothetical protein